MPAATARTWLTPPALPSTSPEAMVCTESTISNLGSHLLDVAQHGRQVALRGQIDVRVQRAHPVRAQPHLGRRLLTADDQHRTLPAAAHSLAADSSSVDLPTPGSPASSTTAPGVSPPPSTRSSSATPLACGLT